MMRKVLTGAFMLICLTSLTVGMSLPGLPTTPEPGCEYKGQHYPLGTIENNHCHTVYCIEAFPGYSFVEYDFKMDCSVDWCVDGIPDSSPDVCCGKRCPNGPSCYYTDGTTILYDHPTPTPDGKSCYCQYVSESEQPVVACN